MTAAQMDDRTGLQDEVSVRPPQEQFYLWAIRIWMRGHWAGQSVDGILRKGFAGMYAADALSGFDALMHCITASWHRPLDITCACRRFLTGDEVYLLDMIRLAHQRPPSDYPAGLLDYAFRASARQSLILHLYQFMRDFDHAVTTFRKPGGAVSSGYQFPIRASVH